MIDDCRQKRKTTDRWLRCALSAAIIAVGFVAEPTWVSAGGSNNPNDLVVIVSRYNGVDRLSIDDVRNYFLLKKRTWPGGDKCIALHPKDERLREAFRKKVLFMTAVDEKRYWQDQMVRAAKKPPPQFGNPEKAVYHLKGAISYVFRKNLNLGVVKAVLDIPVE